MAKVLVVPAIFIQGGRCVSMRPGEAAENGAYSDDPVTIAADFSAAGVERLHLVDLDGVRGSNDNARIVRTIVQESPFEVQVAGGIATEAAVSALLRAGAWSVVLEAAAGRDEKLVRRCAERYPGQVMTTLEVRDDWPAPDVWTETEPILLGDLVSGWGSLGLAGVVLNCVDRDGAARGPDLETLAMIRRMTGHFLLYSGGIATQEQIRRAEAAGAQAVIIGRALYDGRLSLEQALKV